MEYKLKEDIPISDPFCIAVQDLKPVQLLETLRSMEMFTWENDPAKRSYSPSDALMCAIEHDHVDYAQYLLKHYPHKALQSPHTHRTPLVVAVRYGRRKILSHILRATHCLPYQYAYINRPSSMYLEEGKTALHIACELLLSDIILMLLIDNASPHFTDICGRTPLDIILMELWDSKVNTRAKIECLDNLVIFMPKMHFKMKSALEKDAKRWSKILGEHTYNYLVSKNLNPEPTMPANNQKL